MYITGASLIKFCASFTAIYRTVTLHVRLFLCGSTREQHFAEGSGESQPESGKLRSPNPGIGFHIKSS